MPRNTADLSDNLRPVMTQSANKLLRKLYRGRSQHVNGLDLDLIKLEHLTKDKLVVSKKPEDKQARKQNLHALQSKLWQSVQKPYPMEMVINQSNLAIY